MSGIGSIGKSAPGPPDFSAAAKAQADASGKNTYQQTQANRPDQTNAFGATSNWTVNPDGSASQVSGLSGGLASGAQNLESQIGSQGPLGTGDQARDQAITSAYNQSTSRLDPHWAQAGEAQRSQLLNQGLDPGSQAYDAAQGNFDRAKNDAYTSAMASAIGQGTSAQQATFGENLASQQAPYQQLGMLNGLTGQQGFANASKAETPQYLDALMGQYKGDLNKFGSDQGQKNGLLGGASSLASLSDERLKMNIQRLPVEALPGVPFASWEWRHAPGKRRWGVIAQDVQKTRPDLVLTTPGGLLAVDYSFLKD